MTPASGKKVGRPKSEELTSRRRGEILEGATRIFAERSYRNTDLQVLADQLGIGKGTIYRYFPSKRDLFLAAADRGMRQLQEQLDASTVGVEDPLERVACAIRAYLTFFDRHAEFIELLVQERAEFKDRPEPTYFEHRDSRMARWKHLLQQLIKTGRARKLSVDRAVDVVSDLLYGTIFTNYFARRRPSFEMRAQDILNVILYGLLKEGHPAKPRGRKTHLQPRTAM